MTRWILAVAGTLAFLLSGFASALEDKDKDKEREELRRRILKQVEERLKEENKRVLAEVEKILDEELAEMDEEEDEEEEPVKPVKPVKPEPKKEPKPEPKKEPKKEPKPEPKGDEPGYMGVYPEDMQEGMRSLLKLKKDEGVLLVGVAEDGPAAKAGVKANDIVLAVDGTEVGTSEALRDAIMSHKAGESVKLTIFRKKERLDIKVKLAARSDIESETDEEEEMEEEEEEEDSKPAGKRKPKVVFEPRAETPKLDEMTEEELREETREWLEKTLKEEKKKSTPKMILPRLQPVRMEDGEGEGEEEEETPGMEQLKEMAKKFLEDLVEKMPSDMDEKMKELTEKFEMDGKMKELMEKLQEFRAEDMDKLKETMERLLGDDDYLRDLMENMDPERLQEMLKGLLPGMAPGEKPDEENLINPDDEPLEEDPQPAPPPRRVSRAWLGVAPEALSDDMKAQLKIKSGVVVGEVMDDSPAQEAGLKAGDVVLSVDGQEMRSPEDLQEFLSHAKIGAEIGIVVLRKGRKIETSATLVGRKKISVPMYGEPVGDDRGKEKKKAAKKKVEKKELTLPTPKGLRVGILDKNGKLLFSQPMEHMQDMMELGRRFGFQMPGTECQEPCCRDKNRSSKKVERNFQFRFREDENLDRLFRHGQERAEGLRQHLQELRRHFEPKKSGKNRKEKTLRFELENRAEEFHDRMEELHRQFQRRPQENRQRKLVIEEKDLRGELEGARKELEKLLKSKDLPEELREEIEKARREFERSMDRKDRKKPSKKPRMMLAC